LISCQFVNGPFAELLLTHKESLTSTVIKFVRLQSQQGFHLPNSRNITVGALSCKLFPQGMEIAFSNAARIKSLQNLSYEGVYFGFKV